MSTAELRAAAERLRRINNWDRPAEVYRVDYEHDYSHDVAEVKFAWSDAGAVGFAGSATPSQ